MALETVWNQVGWPLRIWSDNGTNYLDVKNRIEQLQNKGEITPIEWGLIHSTCTVDEWLVRKTCQSFQGSFKSMCIEMPFLFALQQRFCVIEAIANQRPILNSADGPISAFQIVTGRTIQANRKHGTNCVESIIQHRSKFVNEMRKN
ncbi:hypothetical protein BLOT_004745 [Blomia tropicalis]|nr:hypothetical protein BLOT_004745 [Blomia tropicalis]